MIKAGRVAAGGGGGGAAKRGATRRQIQRQWRRQWRQAPLPTAAAGGAQVVLAVVAAAQAPEAVKVAAALQWGRVAEAQVPLKMAALKIQRCQMRGGRRQCRGLQREDERRTAGLPLCAQRAQILPLLGLQGGGQSRHP